jgi:hypothetical protein
VTTAVCSARSRRSSEIERVIDVLFSGDAGAVLERRPVLEQSRIPDVSPEPLRRSLSAVVGGGVVSCVGCGSVIALVNAVVGGGYRCQTCSSRMPRTRLANGTAAHAIATRPSQRTRRAPTKAGTELIFIGVTVLALGAIVMPLLFWWPGLAAILLGGTAIGVGVARRNAD